MADPNELTDLFRCFWADDCSWLDVVFAEYTSLLGDAVVGMLLGSAVVLGFWISADDLAMPTVITLLLGGLLFSVLPGDIQQLGFGLVVVGAVAALMEVARRYVL